MKATKDKVVAVSYELNVEGQIVDKAVAEKPLEYIHGMGMLLPKFEAEIEGKEPGEGFAFTLNPTEGYGEYHAEYVINLPKTAFMVDGEVREDLLRVGNLIPMLNQDGQVVQGIVAEIEEESVKMDFNHPMAGKTLNFSGKVESVRDASEKELKEGLHGEFLPPQECGCDGNCGGEGECHHGECQHGEGEHKGCGHGKCCHGKN